MIQYHDQMNMNTYQESIFNIFSPLIRFPRLNDTAQYWYTPLGMGYLETPGKWKEKMKKREKDIRELITDNRQEKTNEIWNTDFFFNLKLSSLDASGLAASKQLSLLALWSYRLTHALTYAPLDSLVSFYSFPFLSYGNSSLYPPPLVSPHNVIKIRFFCIHECRKVFDILS